jgi:CheY-like chemotaxis protein
MDQGDTLLTEKPRVMIVDSSEESRAVLRTLVERQGAEAVEVGRADLAAELVRQHRPDIIVFDAESDNSAAQEATRRLGITAENQDTPIIVLGTVCRRSLQLPTGQFVPKPYHYGPLVRKIEGLLAG